MNGLDDGGIFGAAGVAGPRRTAHEFVKDTLRHAILSGQIARGTVLVQTTLAQQLRVSTTPVREALRDLAAEGLVKLDAHRSAIVQPGSLDEMEEVYSLRILLEPYAARRACDNITEQQLSEARATHERMLATRDEDEWVMLNAVFHQTLVDSAGSPRLSAILKGLRDSALVYVGMRVRGQAMINTANREHEAILDAFARRDKDAAAAAILNHLDETRQRAGQALSQ